MKKLILKEFCGQNKDVEINMRENGSVYVIFTTQAGYGNPALEEDDIKRLFQNIETFKTL